jgi:hypothetical protein
MKSPDDKNSVLLHHLNKGSVFIVNGFVIELSSGVTRVRKSAFKAG